MPRAAREIVAPKLIPMSAQGADTRGGRQMKAAATERPKTYAELAADNDALQNKVADLRAAIRGARAALDED